MFQVFSKCKWDQVEKLLYLQLSETAAPSFHQVMFSCKERCKEILTTHKLKEVKRVSHFATTISHAHCTYSEHPAPPMPRFCPLFHRLLTHLIHSLSHMSTTPPLQPLFGKLRAINMSATWLVSNQAGQFYCYLNDCKADNRIFQFSQ